MLSSDIGGMSLDNCYPDYMVTSTDVRGTTSSLLLSGYMVTSLMLEKSI